MLTVYLDPIRWRNLKLPNRGAQITPATPITDRARQNASLTHAVTLIAPARRDLLRPSTGCTFQSCRIQQRAKICSV